MYLFEAYKAGTLETVLSEMETKAIIKSFRLHCFGIPSKNREKVIRQFINCMEKAYAKGSAFL